MRDRDVEVTVVRADSDKLTFSEKTINSVTYALVPSAGCEYLIRVTLHRNKYTRLFPFEDVPCQCIKIGLYIDGIDCGYYKRIAYSKSTFHNSISCEFTGFRKAGNNVQAFVLSNTVGTIDINTSSNSTSKNIGDIKVTLNMAIATDETYENKSLAREVPGASKLIDNNQKYFNQAKFSTGGGRVIPMSFNKTTQWNNVNTVPDKTIIMKYQKTDIVEALAASLNSSSSSSSSGTGVFKRVRDTDESNSPSKAKRAIMVDLTGEEEEVQEVEAPPVEVAMLDLETGIETVVVQK